MFRNLLRIFRKETVPDGSNSTKDAVLLLGYRFAGHCRNAETRAAGEKEFYEGLKTTLTESKVIPSQGEVQLDAPAFPLLSCNGFVTGNVIPLKIMLEDQNDIVDRINTVLPSHVRVYDVIETSPDFQITGWDEAVCSCYIPTCLLNSSAKNYIGHRINERTISKLHETSKQFCSLKDFGAFKLYKMTSDQDSVTKFDILPCFHQNGCEYIQLVVGFKGLTIQDIQRVVGVSLAVARNDIDLEEILESHRRLELPYFPRLMLDEVQFDTYNKSLEGNKSYRQIDWTLIQGAQNEFKRKLFLPGMVEQDTTKTFWWKEFIFRRADLSPSQEIKVIETNIKSSTEKAKEKTFKDTDKTAGTSSVKPKNLRSDQNMKLQEDMTEEKINMETGKANVENIKETSEEKIETKPTLSTKNFNLSSNNLAESTSSLKKLKERLAMNSDKSDEKEVSYSTSDPSSDVPHEFLTFAEASIRSFNAYLSAVDKDLTKGKKVQSDMREHRKSPVDMMQANPTQVDQFWNFYKTLDQIELTSNTFLDLCEDLHSLLIDQKVYVKLKGKRSRRKNLVVSMKDVLSKLQRCVQNIKELKQGQDEIIDGMIQVTTDSKDESKLTESSDNIANDDKTVLSTVDGKEDNKSENLQKNQKIIDDSKPKDDMKILEQSESKSNVKSEKLLSKFIEISDDKSDGQITKTVQTYVNDNKYKKPSNIDQKTVVLGHVKRKNDGEENQQIKKIFGDKVKKINEWEMSLSEEFRSNEEDFAVIRPLFETYDSGNDEEKEFRKHRKINRSPKPTFRNNISDFREKKQRKEKSLIVDKKLIKSSEKTVLDNQENVIRKDFDPKSTNFENEWKNAKMTKEKSLNATSWNSKNNNDKERNLSSSKNKSVTEHTDPKDEPIKNEQEVDKGAVKGKGKSLPKLEELF